MAIENVPRRAGATIPSAAEAQAAGIEHAQVGELSCWVTRRHADGYPVTSYFDVPEEDAFAGRVRGEQIARDLAARVRRGGNCDYSRDWWVPRLMWTLRAAIDVIHTDAGDWGRTRAHAAHAFIERATVLTWLGLIAADEGNFTRWVAGAEANLADDRARRAAFAARMASARAAKQQARAVAALVAWPRSAGAAA